MQGDGLGLDGRTYHIDSLGDGGWVTADGADALAGERLVGRRPVLARRAATGATGAAR